MFDPLEKYWFECKGWEGLCRSGRIREKLITGHLPRRCPVVLHGAAILLEQAKPQTLYTQVVNYNPPKNYNSTHSYLQYLAMLGMVCEIEGHCFEFWSLGVVLGKWTV